MGTTSILIGEIHSTSTGVIRIWASVTHPTALMVIPTAITTTGAVIMILIITATDIMETIGLTVTMAVTITASGTILHITAITRTAIMKQMA